MHGTFFLGFPTESFYGLATASDFQSRRKGEMNKKNGFISTVWHLGNFEDPDWLISDLKPDPSPKQSQAKNYTFYLYLYILVHITKEGGRKVFKTF
jgi:hypothetical protein